ncbi:MAG: neutral/alkaline non-lysosomal ceramidase N-terminal domain-containing protein, partial [Kiritimatiellia bacterium]
MNNYTGTSSSALRLGVAHIDITPPVGVTLWGYNPRISTSIEHRLRAEALACESSGGGWLLLSADIGAFAAPFANPLRAEIAASIGLPATAVMLAATHTHSGPHVTDAGWCERSPLETEYFQELRRKLIAVATAAWQQRAPGELVYAQTSAPDLASNRRIQREDGSWTNEFNDPEGRHTGYYDPAVELVGIRRPDGRLEALLVNFGCHPVSFGGRNLGISGDYVSYLKDALETDGATGTAIFTVSGHANVDPRHGVQDDPEVVRKTGEHLASIVKTALPGLQPVAGNAVAAIREPWNFVANWSISGRV